LLVIFDGHHLGLDAVGAIHSSSWKNGLSQGEAEAALLGGYAGGGPARL
jgi:hypothetical protein